MDIWNDTEVIDEIEKITEISDKLVKKVEAEASSVVKEFIQEDKLGYKYYLYQEMKKRFSELGIDWEIPCSDSSSVNEK